MTHETPQSAPLKAWLRKPSLSKVLVVGGGHMGSDITSVFLRAGCTVWTVEPAAGARERMVARFAGESALTVHEALEHLDLHAFDLALECIVEDLPRKQQLFAALDRRLRPDALLCSNSSSYPISEIGAGLTKPSRMLGLHFFTPAHLIPLVEVVMGAGTDPGLATELRDFMGLCGMVPVVVRKDLPGFLANRLQHALAREAFAMVEAGVASLEDVDAAVRFGFGMRFLAAGPMLQRDHNGLEVHMAAAKAIYPSLANNGAPGETLWRSVAAGRFGLKTHAGLFDWPEAKAQAERERYDGVLARALDVLAKDLPPRPVPS